MLNDQFKDRPGGREVKMRQYRIVSAETFELILSEDNWELKIVPRMRIVMSVQVIAPHTDMYPRGCGTTPDRICELRAVWSSFLILSFEGSIAEISSSTCHLEIDLT